MTSTTHIHHPSRTAIGTELVELAGGLRATRVGVLLLLAPLACPPLATLLAVAIISALAVAVALALAAAVAVTAVAVPAIAVRRLAAYATMIRSDAPCR